MFNNAQITAQTGTAVINTANPNLDGTGTFVTLLTAGTNGTFLNSIVVKATGPTTPGMVRIFIEQGGNKRLFEEFTIPACEPSGTLQAFQAMVALDGYWLANGSTLCATTENSETFNVYAEGFEWSYS